MKLLLIGLKWNFYVLIQCCFTPAFLSDEELAVVRKLKELTEQHRAQLIIKDKELLEKSNELEKVRNIFFKYLFVLQNFDNFCKKLNYWYQS